MLHLRPAFFAQWVINRIAAITTAANGLAMTKVINQ
jgi:hypothetical protein